MLTYVFPTIWQYLTHRIIYFSYSSSDSGGKLLLPTEDKGAMSAYTADWTRKWIAKDCPAVLQPHTVDQVSSILKHCNDRGIAVVPQV